MKHLKTKPILVDHDAFRGDNPAYDKMEFIAEHYDELVAMYKDILEHLKQKGDGGGDGSLFEKVNYKMPCFKVGINKQFFENDTVVGEDSENNEITFKELFGGTPEDISKRLVYISLNELDTSSINSMLNNTAYLCGSSLLDVMRTFSKEYNLRASYLLNAGDDADDSDPYITGFRYQTLKNLKYIKTATYEVFPPKNSDDSIWLMHQGLVTTTENATKPEEYEKLLINKTLEFSTYPSSDFKWINTYYEFAIPYLNNNFNRRLNYSSLKYQLGARMPAFLVILLPNVAVMNKIVENSSPSEHTKDCEYSFTSLVTIGKQFYCLLPIVYTANSLDRDTYCYNSLYLSPLFYKGIATRFTPDASDNSKGNYPYLQSIKYLDSQESNNFYFDNEFYSFVKGDFRKYTGEGDGIESAKIFEEKMNMYTYDSVDDAEVPKINVFCSLLTDYMESEEVVEEFTCYRPKYSVQGFLPYV